MPPLLPELAEPVCRKIFELFDQGIPFFYDDESANLTAKVDPPPLMTISLAIVENQPHHFINHLELAKVAAQLKVLAKNSLAVIFSKTDAGASFLILLKGVA